MAERSSLNQVIQVGIETTPGTAVAATKKFQSIGIEPSPSVEMDEFRPAGQKYRALTTLGKEWTEASISGRGTYTELIYLLSSVVSTPTISTPVGATGARNWKFVSDPSEDDVPKTMTVEHGSSVRAGRFTYGLVTEIGMTFNRTSIEVSGSMMGREIEDNIVRTLDPTTVALVPIVPTQVSVYMDDEFADLGTTKMLRTVSAEWSLGSRFAGVWVLDADQPSFVNHIESEPDLTMSMTMQADSQGMALLDTLREGDTKFIRVEAVGNLIEGAIPYRFSLDLAGKVSDTGGFSDADGVYAVEFSFVGVADGGWGRAFEVNVVNALTAL